MTAIRFPALLILTMLSAPALADPWTLDVGGAVVEQPVYPGSHRDRLVTRPVVSATYGTRLKASIDDGLTWVAFDLGKVEVGPVVEYRLKDRLGRSGGYPQMGNAIETGLFVRAETPVAELEARVRKAINGYAGWSADVSADTGISFGSNKLGAEARATWADYRFVRSRFGMEALHGRTPDMRDFDPPLYLSAGVELDFSRHLGAGLDATLIASHDWLIGNVRSPLIATHGIRQFGLALTRHFGSQQKSKKEP